MFVLAVFPWVVDSSACITRNRATFDLLCYNLPSTSAYSESKGSESASLIQDGVSGDLTSASASLTVSGDPRNFLEGYSKYTFDPSLSTVRVTFDYTLETTSTFNHLLSRLTVLSLGMHGDYQATD